MIPGSLKPFLQKLLKATEKGEVAWQEGAAPNSYFCAHKSYSLYFNNQFDHDREVGSYTMRIQNNGKAAFVIVEDNEDEFFFMRDLFSSVSVSAAGMDDIADDFFS